MLKDKNLEAFKKDLKDFYSNQDSFSGKVKRRKVVFNFSENLYGKDLLHAAKNHGMKISEFKEYLKEAKKLYN